MRNADEFWQRKRPDGSLAPVYWTNLFGRRVSTGCKTKRSARAWKEAKEFEGANPRLAAAKRASLEDAVRDLLAELARRGRRPATIEKIRGKLGHYPRLWGCKRKLATIDLKLVNAYVDTRLTERGTGTARVKRITIRDELAALRQMLKLARRHQLYPFAIDDVLPDRFETGHVARKDFVPFSDLPALLAKLPEHRVAHVLYFTVCGGRTADSFRARLEDFDTEQWRITVRGSKTRASWRTIPVPDFLRWNVARLVATAPGDRLLFAPWCDGSMNRDIKAACRRAGIEPVSTNGLRRTFGHALRVHGYSLDVISKLFGHTTEKLARDVYADFTADELAEKVARQGEQMVLAGMGKPGGKVPVQNQYTAPPEPSHRSPLSGSEITFVKHRSSVQARLAAPTFLSCPGDVASARCAVGAVGAAVVHGFGTDSVHGTAPAPSSSEDPEGARTPQKANADTHTSADSDRGPVDFQSAHTPRTIPIETTKCDSNWEATGIVAVSERNEPGEAEELPEDEADPPGGAGAPPLELPTVSVRPEGNSDDGHIGPRPGVARVASGAERVRLEVDGAELVATDVAPGELVANVEARLKLAVGQRGGLR